MTATTSGASHYAILGLTPDATADEVKKAFNRAAKHLHPDRVGGIELPFYLLAVEARDVLLDPERRAAYDAMLTAPTPTPEPEPVPEPVWEGEETVNLDDEDDPEPDFEVNVDFDVVDDTPAPSPGKWAKKPPAEDALPSTPQQRRFWWRATCVLAVGMFAEWGWAVRGTMQRVPPGNEDFAMLTVALGMMVWIPAALWAMYARPFRRLLVAVLALSTLTCAWVGWSTWQSTGGHVHLPFNPFGVAGFGFLLAIVGQRVRRMQQGPDLDDLHDTEEVLDDE